MFLIHNYSPHTHFSTNKDARTVSLLYVRAQRADVLLAQFERNAKKIRQTMQNGGQWDIRIISANVRIMNELEYILDLINSIWENSECNVTAFN